MKNRAHIWLLVQGAMTAGLAVLIVVLARSVVTQVDRAAEEKARTLARTVVSAIQGVIRHGPDQEGRVHGILEEVARDPEVLAVGIVEPDGTPVTAGGGTLPTPGSLPVGPGPLVTADGRLVVALPFDVPSGCMASPGSCRCATGGCHCLADEDWAVPAGRYLLVLVLDRHAAGRVKLPVVAVAGLGVAILAALLLVSALLVRSLGARERLAHRMALEQQRRQSLESLGLLAAGLAHEIKNPLGSIRGWAQLLHEGAAGPEDRERTALMLGELDRVGERLEEFLGFARKRRLAAGSVDLRAVAHKTATLLQPDAEAAGIDLRVVAPSGPVEVRGDEVQLGELVLNLALNAVDACEPGGSIRLELTSGSPPALEVIDDGRGIRAEDLDRLFDPYFTTKKRGSGLGLPISRRIAEDHGAVLTVANGEERGAVARLAFVGEAGGPS
jgi:two-component system sensor histidine kinase HydH